ncbi:MAG: preprotein translocase subunit YajC [Gaiellaceae bacterium]|jgi:preprotein translocase subunit YajC
MGSAGFLIIIVAFAFLYFVLVRPQKRRQVESQRMLQGLEVGDEVVTAGGIYGRITAIRDDEVTVEIAPELEVRVARRAIGGVVNRQEEPDGNDPAEADEAEAGKAPAEEHDG